MAWFRRVANVLRPGRHARERQRVFSPVFAYAGQRFNLAEAGQIGRAHV